MIGARLCEQAFWYGSGCNWISRYIIDDAIKYDASLSTLANHALGPDLYGGTSGIAIFLSYLYTRTKNEEYSRTAEGAIRQALSRLEDISPKTRLGLYSGYVGIGIMFGDNSILEQALDILRILEIDNHSEHLMDVISGNAGAIPSLLEMYEIFHENKIFDLAINLGNKLLSSSVKEEVGLSWDSKVNGVESSQHNLTGFSHGAAGIGYSLLELFTKTDRKEYRKAAEQAFAYENKWFNSQNDNWPDFRRAHGFEDGEHQGFAYSTAWCHGAPGIGLSRLRDYQILKDENNLNDSYAAIRTAVRSVKEMNTH
jgi:lantibiotic modifying enzyme